MAEVGRTGTAARHLRKFLFTPLQPCHSYFRPSFGVKHSWTTDYNKQFFMAKTAVATPTATATASAATPTPNDSSNSNSSSSSNMDSSNTNNKKQAGAAGQPQDRSRGRSGDHNLKFDKCM